MLLLISLPTDAGAATIELPHFRFHLTEGSAGAARRLAEIAEDRYLQLCTPIGACDAPKTKIDVWLAEDAEAFAAAFPDGSPMSEWAVGVTFVDKNRIVLRAHGSALFSLLETFDHELSHALVHAMVPRERLPRWFSEGVAIWQSGEAVMKRLMEAQRAALTSNLMPLSELTRTFPRQGPKVSLSYAQSALFLRYLERHHGVVGASSTRPARRAATCLPREGSGPEPARSRLRPDPAPRARGPRWRPLALHRPP